jgi:TonB family protein
MKLRNALLISFAGHYCVFAPLGNIWVPAPDKKNPPAQVVYYKVNPPLEVKSDVKAEVKSPPPKEEPIRVEKGRAGQARPVRKSRPVKTQQPSSQPVQTAQVKPNAAPPSIPGTSLPNTPECVSYYSYMREKIRHILEKYYTPGYEEGDVAVKFVLNPNGELIGLNIINSRSSDSEELRDLAKRSIQSAAPFKPLPKNLNQEQISFNLPVVFKQK